MNKLLSGDKWMIWLSLGWVGLMVICVFSCSTVNKKIGLLDDNIIEEVFEDLVEDKLGLPQDSLDFTP